jgi:hypothetical protein
LNRNTELLEGTIKKLKVALQDTKPLAVSATTLGPVT